MSEHMPERALLSKYLRKTGGLRSKLYAMFWKVFKGWDAYDKFNVASGYTCPFLPKHTFLYVSGVFGVLPTPHLPSGSLELCYFDGISIYPTRWNARSVLLPLKQEQVLLHEIDPCEVVEYLIHFINDPTCFLVPSVDELLGLETGEGKYPFRYKLNQDVLNEIKDDIFSPSVVYSISNGWSISFIAIDYLSSGWPVLNSFQIKVSRDYKTLKMSRKMFSRKIIEGIEMITA